MLGGRSALSDISNGVSRESSVCGLDEGGELGAVDVWVEMRGLDSLVAPPGIGEVVQVSVRLPTKPPTVAQEKFTSEHIVADVAWWAISQLAAAHTRRQVEGGAFDGLMDVWEMNGWDLSSDFPRTRYAPLASCSLAEAGLLGRVGLRLEPATTQSPFSAARLPEFANGSEAASFSLPYVTSVSFSDQNDSQCYSDASFGGGDITTNILGEIQESMMKMNLQAAVTEADGNSQEDSMIMSDEDSIVDALAGLCLAPESDLEEPWAGTREEEEEEEVEDDIGEGEESEVEDEEAVEEGEESDLDTPCEAAGVMGEKLSELNVASDSEASFYSIPSDSIDFTLPDPVAEPEDRGEEEEVVAEPVIVSQPVIESDSDDGFNFVKKSKWRSKRVLLDSASEEDDDFSQSPAAEEAVDEQGEAELEVAEQEATVASSEAEAGDAFDYHEQPTASNFFADECSSGGDEVEDGHDEVGEAPGEVEADDMPYHLKAEIPSPLLRARTSWATSSSDRELSAAASDATSPPSSPADVAWNVAERLVPNSPTPASLLPANSPAVVMPSSSVVATPPHASLPPVSSPAGPIVIDLDSSLRVDETPLPAAGEVSQGEEEADAVEGDATPWRRRIILDSSVDSIEGLLPTYMSDGLNKEGTTAPAASESDSDSEEEERDLHKALAAAWDHRDDVLVSHCSEDGSVPGLLVKLHPHQRIGVNWMVSREHETHRDIQMYGASARGGGILADDMGLGKTIQTLGLILCNRSPVKFKCTLIVCTLSTVNQWHEEINNRVADGQLKVCLYYGPSRTKDPFVLMDADVVLTTYGVMASEFAKADRDARGILNPDDRPADTGMKKKRKRGAPKEKKIADNLYRIQWWRVVLDEAHAIKNRSTKKHKAACGLAATHHWCLTGTPIENSPYDLWSLLHFSQAPKCHNVKYFKSLLQDVKNSNSAWAFQQIKDLVRPSLLRRKKAVLGEEQPASVKLPALPPCTVNHVLLPFAKKEESVLYHALWTNARQKFEAMQKKGTVLKNVMHILELILRCRQACVHPYMLINAEELPGRLPIEDDQKQQASESADFALPNRKLGVMALQLQSTEAPAVLEKTHLGPDRSCGVCSCSMEDPIMVLPCSHMFCRECVIKSHAPLSRCIRCEQLVTGIKDVPVRSKRKSVSADALRRAVAEESEPAATLASLPNKVLTQIFSLVDFQTQWALSSVCKRFYGLLDKVYSQPYASTKVDALVEILKRDVSVKSVVFSQFATVMNVVQHRLFLEGITCVRLDGSMPMQKRVHEIDRFREEEGVQVFLISLKAGCCGLNLSQAQQVFLMDPWWNPAVEQQAIDRVHRMGQTKPVSVHKLIIKGSMEEEILKLQEKKRGMSEAVLASKSTLSAEDLSEVFSCFSLTSGPEGSASSAQ